MSRGPQNNNGTAGCFPGIFGGGDVENAISEPVNSILSVTSQAKNFRGNQSGFPGSYAQKKAKRKAQGSDGTDNPDSEHSDLSSLIASELTKLSIEDRVKALEEVHGVVQNIEEDPNEINKLFDKVKEELKRLRYKQAYEKAAFLSSTYVNNPQFVLSFLRADNYNPRHTAIRLAEHFKFKLELFGEHTLVRDILYDDLTEEEKVILNSGFFNFLPSTDRAGRQIVACNMNKFLEIGNLMNVCRAVWYAALRNSQINRTKISMGVVGVYFAHGMGNIFEKLNSNNKKIFANGTGFMQNALPYKLASVHFCFENNSNFGVAIQHHIMMSLGRYARIRLRSHHGSRLECEYALKSFGIDINTYEAKMPSGSMQAWVEQCKALDESHRRELETRVIPGPNDVLLGRGRPFQLYPGNLALTAKIDANRPRYAAAKKMHKKAITIGIVEDTLKSGCCFLKKVNKSDEGQCDWEEVDFETARLKVSHSFRTQSKGHLDNEEIVAEPIPSISAEDMDPLDLMDISTPPHIDPVMMDMDFSSNKRLKW